jgi:hypothetical protein
LLSALGPAVVLRAIVTNPFTEISDLNAVLKEQIEIGDSLWGKEERQAIVETKNSRAGVDDRTIDK